jgi:serine/threonine protein kinase
MYVSPEQAAGEVDIGIQSDLYSLGATLFHLSTGSPPFSELNTSLLLTRKLTEDVPDLRTVNPTASPALAHLVAKLCQRFVEHRPRNPAAALVILDQLESGELAVSEKVPAPTDPRAKLRPAEDYEVEPGNAILQTIVTDEQLSAKPHFLEKEQVLFYEDDQSRDCYLLLSGSVDVLKAGRRIATISKPGSFLGEMSPLRGEPRSATVLAAEQTVLLVIPEAKFHEFFSRHAPLAMELARSLAERLEHTNQAYRDATARLVAVQKTVRRLNAELGEL